MTKGIKHEAYERHEEFARAMATIVCHTIVTWQWSRFSL
jgi:hypothetical protein